METLGFSYGDGDALDTSWTLVPLGASVDAARALDAPVRTELDNLSVHLTGLSGGAAEVTFFLARAANGARKITPSNTTGATAAIDLLDGDATQGDVVWELGDLALVLEAGDVLTLGLKLDVGAATGHEDRLTWRRW